jgi:hypothetical protein
MLVELYCLLCVVYQLQFWSLHRQAAINPCGLKKYAAMAEDTMTVITKNTAVHSRNNKLLMERLWNEWQ